MHIKTVTVIGATGTMGANVAAIFAAFGDAKVYCVGRDIEKVRKTIPRMVRSVRADAIKNNLIPADFSMLDQCVAESDLVFESSVEDIHIKTSIAKRVGAALQPHSVACTGSSGLSINEIAQCYPKDLRGHFFGVHMFNPPYSMTLCELISTDDVDQTLRTELKEYLKNKLFRTVVEVKDSPAFLGNRIGFQFINEALHYAEEYKDSGGIDYIDAILGTFTGRAMPPLVTSDFVGLDVHKAIVDNIYANTHDDAHETFVLPEFAKRLIEDGKLGRKTGCGLYQLLHFENGVKRQTVYDISTGVYRDVIPYMFPFVVSMKKSISEGDYQQAFETLIHNHSQEATICLTFLLKYILYALYTAKTVGYSLESADDVMATGFNWCPPLAMYHALNSVIDVKTLIHERIPDIYNRINIDALFSEIKNSKYDYRPFFKSGR